MEIRSLVTCSGAASRSGWRRTTFPAQPGAANALLWPARHGAGARAHAAVAPGTDLCERTAHPAACPD